MYFATKKVKNTENLKFERNYPDDNITWPVLNNI